MPEAEAAAEDRGGAGGVPLRPVLVVAGLVVLALIAYGGYSCLSAAGSSTFSDSAGRYPPGSVTYLASAHTYLLRQADGSFLALSEVEAADADRTAGCLIRYRPDLTAAGQTGVFQDDCHGTLFNRTGAAIQGSSPPMQRHPVDLSGNTVSVHVKECLADSSTQLTACRI